MTQQSQKLKTQNIIGVKQFLTGYAQIPSGDCGVGVIKQLRQFYKSQFSIAGIRSVEYFPAKRFA